MALSNIYVMSLARFPAFFQQIKDAQAPNLFTQQLLKDWGFGSSNDRSFIPLLKVLGFLTSDGKPTNRYLEYRDHSKSRRMMGEGIKDAYQEIFMIKEKPSESDREAIKGKFKSHHNTSDNVAGLMTSTFLKLVEMADLDVHSNPKPSAQPDIPENPIPSLPIVTGKPQIPVSGLHYNIQIHLPPTKDIEIYNAIFKSMKEHLLEG